MEYLRPAATEHNSCPVEFEVIKTKTSSGETLWIVLPKKRE